MNVEVFGTMFKPHARWTCPCGTPNVTHLVVPIRSAEPAPCRRCHKLARLNFDMSMIPRFWGGTKEEMQPNATSR